MPAYQHHFLPLDPPPSSTEECDALECLGSIFYGVRSGEVLPVRVLGTSNVGVRVIAVTLPAALADHPDREKWFRQIMETLLCSIRLSYDPAAQPVYFSDGFINMMYESDEAEPRYQLLIQPTTNQDWRVNIDRVLGVFREIHDPNKSIVSALLAESQIPSIPPHYAVLSLIRAIEILWPDENERNDVLDENEAAFAILRISERRFRNALPQLRNRCAHGKGRGRGEPEPFVGLGYNSPALRPLKRLLAALVAEAMRAKFGMQVTGPPTPA